MKTKIPKITAHMMVKNEEYWVWYSIMSILPFVESLIIFDTGSTDDTLRIIRNIKSKKLRIFEKGEVEKENLFKLRNDMIQMTKTNWFLLVDGDEIWNKQTLKKIIRFISKVDKKTFGIVMRTRNCVGDIYHYLPNDAGQYSLMGKRGHLTIRVYRKNREYKWLGEYPLESYADKNNVPINEKSESLAFFDNFYWHVSHLPRTSSKKKVYGFRTIKIEKGIKISEKDELPNVLFSEKDREFHNPLEKRSWFYELLASIITPLKVTKRKLSYG